MFSAGQTDMYYAKYGPRDELLWAQRIGGQGFDRGAAIAVDNLRDEEDIRPSHSYGHAFRVPGQSRGRHLHEIHPKVEPGQHPKDVDKDMHVYVAGVSDMGQDAVAGNFLLANVPEARMAWVAKSNATTGKVKWARSLAHCLSDVSYQPWDADDPRNPNRDTMGDCRPKASAVDGHGDVITTGSFLGTMDFPTQSTWEPIIRRWSDKQREAVSEATENTVKDALGLLGYCALATWKTLPCVGNTGDTLLDSMHQIFWFKLDWMKYELEEEDTAVIFLQKVRDRLRIQDINSAFLEEDVTIEIPQYLPSGAMAPPITQTVKRNISDDTRLVDFFAVKNLTLTICNETIHKTNRLMNLTKMCSQSQVEPKCKDDSVSTCKRIWHCPERCYKDSDCANNAHNSVPTFCHDGTCAARLGTCQQWDGFRTPLRLESRRDSCYTKASRGRVCQPDWFVAKLGRYGEFEWAMKVWETKRPVTKATGAPRWAPTYEQLYWEERALQHMRAAKGGETDELRIEDNFPFNNTASNFSYFQSAMHQN